jgi:hypothetical protein
MWVTSRTSEAPAIAPGIRFGMNHFSAVFPERPYSDWKEEDSHGRKAHD